MKYTLIGLLGMGITSIVGFKYSQFSSTILGTMIGSLILVSFGFFIYYDYKTKDILDEIKKLKTKERGRK